MEDWKLCFIEIIERLNVNSDTKMSTKGSLVMLEPNEAEQDGHSSTESSVTPRPTFYRPQTTILGMTDLSISCVTWNLAESLPEMEHLGFMQRYRQADVVCIGVQECQKLISRNSTGQLSTTDVWESMLKAALGGTFARVGSKAMGGVHMVIYCKKDIAFLLTNVTFGMVACGIGNVIYNKGAVGCSFNFKSKSFCVLTGHFQANRQRVNERDDDFWRIDTLMPGLLGKHEPHDPNPTPGIDSIHESNLRRVSSVFGLVPESEDRSRSLVCERFDHSFFIGDFNYRIEMDIEEVKHWLKFLEELEPTIHTDSVASVHTDSGGEEFKRASTLRMNMAMAQIQEENEYDSDEAEHKRESMMTDDASTITDSISSGNFGPFAGETLEEFSRRTGLRSREEILERLLSLDQLNLHRANGQVFLGYEEPKITFKPSYKFDPYTENYDTSKKNRGAAWCDRVLYSKKNRSDVKVIDYHCNHGSYHSDHRAVGAEFVVHIQK